MTFCTKCLNLVTHNLPYPPDNGGLMDIYYKLKSFSECGMDVILHSFNYNNRTIKEINKYCKVVNLYERKFNPLLWFSLKPFIVNSRRSSKLLQNLIQNEHPILFDTLHTTFFLSHKILNNRKKFVRTHNVEHIYYKKLSESAHHIGKKFYYFSESVKLKNYENILSFSNGIFAISLYEKIHFNQYAPTLIIPPFHPVQFNPGKDVENFALYHGNLSVEENQKAVEWLIDDIWQDKRIKNIPLVISGNGAPTWLKNKIYNSSNIKLLDKLKTEDILALVSKARLNVLPTFQNTGVKLKLIVALGLGHHIVVNKLMTEGTGLEGVVPEATDSEEFIENIILCWNQKKVSSHILAKRENLFAQYLNNNHNALLMINYIFKNNNNSFIY